MFLFNFVGWVLCIGNFNWCNKVRKGKKYMEGRNKFVDGTIRYIMIFKI